MSYGLYISDGVNGGVITNANNVFNEEYDFELTNQALSAGGTYNIQTSGAGNPALIGIHLSANNSITVSRDTTNDRIVISNTSGGSQSFSAKIFRFQ